MSKPTQRGTGARRCEFVVVAVLTVGILLSACGGGSSGSSGSANTGSSPGGKSSGDIPDTQHYVRYTPSAGGYAVMYPEGWARIDGSNQVTFTDNENAIRIDQQPAPTAPDVSSVRANELAALAATMPGFALQDVTTVSRPAGTAVLITYQASGTPDPVTGKRLRVAVQRYEFWRNGKRVALTLSSPVGADNVDPWRKVTDSFTWQP